MRHESLGLVEAVPVQTGGRFAFQACFDFVAPTLSVEQARRNFELGTYARNARAPRPSPALAATVLQAADSAFPVAPDKKDSMHPLKEAAALLGLALQDLEQANPSDAVTAPGGFEFPGDVPENRDGRSPQDAELHLDEPLPLPTDERLTPGTK